jgi:hypothetical protein
MTMPFAKDQPKDGDLVVRCGHVGGESQTGHWHWWKIPDGEKMRFRRPDGTSGEVGWLVACQNCFNRSGGDPSRVEFRGDSIWKGNAPAVRENKQ